MERIKLVDVPERKDADHASSGHVGTISDAMRLTHTINLQILQCMAKYNRVLSVLQEDRARIPHSGREALSNDSDLSVCPCVCLSVCHQHRRSTCIRHRASPLVMIQGCERFMRVLCKIH